MKRLARVQAPALALAGLMALCLATGTAAQARPIYGMGTWETTLQPRDMNSDGVVDAFYDTVLDISWLADGNALDDVHGNLGRIALPLTEAWVAGLNLYGMRGWRLPMMKDTGGPGCAEYNPIGGPGGTDCGFNVQTISADGKTVYSELAHLLHVTLGMPPLTVHDGSDAEEEADLLGNTGHFRRLQDWMYWTGVRDVTDPQHKSWVFHMGVGHQFPAYNSGPDDGFHAIAVHPGDVGLPEPPTAALVLASLAGLWLARQRAPRQGLAIGLPAGAVPNWC